LKSYVRRAALLGSLLAVPIWTASAASAATVPVKPAASATSAPSCPSSGAPRIPYWFFDRPEALIGNLSPAPGSTVAPGSTISFLVADKEPFRAPLSRDVFVIVDGRLVTATAGAEESGVPITYASSAPNGSRSTNCEVPFSFALPAKISGSVHISVIAIGGDGGIQTVRWSLTVGTVALPNGAIGGIGVAAAGGLVLMVVQLRRRKRR
jgi:hypothetical protein